MRLTVIADGSHVMSVAEGSHVSFHDGRASTLRHYTTLGTAFGYRIRRLERVRFNRIHTQPGNLYERHGGLLMHDSLQN
jgi:hypothetical protein